MNKPQPGPALRRGGQGQPGAAVIDPWRRAFLACSAGVVLAALAPLGRAASPLLFHDHGHGLAFSPDGRALLAPSHSGVAAYEDGAWWEAAGPERGFSAFAVTERGLYSSGHAGSGARAGRPFGLARSTDGGRTWRVLALAGEADFSMLAAGYRSGAIYVLNGSASSAMDAGALYATLDEGNTWRRAAARGLAGEIHGLAAHPLLAGTLAAATGRGLYLSRDGGESFKRLDGTGTVTAVAFDLGGERLRYARALSNEILQIGLDGRHQRSLAVPPLPGDYVTCLAQSPVFGRVLAIATRRRDVYLSGDGGSTWRTIASASEGR
jgi:photosystem II stability/assembly factor-like uncharacterized protein